jgi:VanZ family protein
MIKPWLARWMLCFSVLLIVAATLTPSRQAATSGFLCFACGDLGGVDAVLNVLLFVPFGLGLGLLNLTRTRAIQYIVLATVIIELAQFQVIPGRDASAGDVLTNSVGGALGFLIGSNPLLLIRPPRSVAARLFGLCTLVLLLIHAIGAYALLPALTDLPYYGQIARHLGRELSGFPGVVLRPTIGSHTIRDWGFVPPEVRDLLSRKEGTPVQTTVVPRSCPATTAGIVHLVDTDGRAILILAQHGPDLIYGMRTGAKRLRLRPVRYALAHVFGPKTCEVRGDTIVIYAHGGRRLVSLHATNRSFDLSVAITPTTAESWRLIMPWQTYASGGLSSRIASTIWIFLIALPLAYWAGFMTNTIRSALLSGIVACVACAALPHFFEIPVMGLYEWGGAAAAILFGGWASMRQRGKKDLCQTAPNERGRLDAATNNRRLDWF